MRNPYHILLVGLLMLSFASAEAADKAAHHEKGNRSGNTAAATSQTTGDDTAGSTGNTPKKAFSLPPNTVSAWKVDELFAGERQADPDTATLNHQLDTALPHKYSLASEWCGNMGSPAQPAIFRDRYNPALIGQYLFLHPYRTYYAGASDVLFYNTKIPYSNLTWTSGGQTHRSEDRLKGVLAVNATPKLNFALTADYIYGVGQYYNQSTDDLIGALNGSYRGERYSIYFIAGLNNFRNYENGGLADASLFGQTQTYTLPTKLDYAWSVYRSFYFWVNQQYRFGYHKTDPDDTEKTEFVPVATLAYTLKFEGGRKKYYESRIGSYYAQNLYNESVTRDTTSNNLMRNIFSVTLNEGFKKWMVFDLRAYAEVDVEQNMCLTGDSLYGYKNEALVAVGGEISDRKGATQYNVLGQALLLGYDKVPGFDVSGDFSTDIPIGKEQLQIRADGYVKSTNPAHFMRHYYSNHFAWDNDFGNVWSARAYGSAGIPNKYCDVSVGAGWDGVKNYLYFDQQALPQQSPDFIQVLSVDAKLNLSVWWLHWDNSLTYQQSTHPETLPLPAFSVYSNFYLRHKLFKKLLTVQLGVDCRYNTSYYANAYMPATGQFYLQNETLVGNYPLMNLYLNMHLKHFRVYLMYYNMSSLFMKQPCYTTPGHPLNPGIFKFGISWNFYN
ncbi:MAG: putative porin [Paludibacteraceae bacterium]|nr:putative porin [Paludibacteraceae bacterium]